jgi:hypothetical protein
LRVFQGGCREDCQKNFPEAVAKLESNLKVEMQYSIEIQDFGTSDLDLKIEKGILAKGLAEGIKLLRSRED